MVLHAEKTLKTSIQKNVPKSQKFGREIFVAEFRYSQTIFFAVRSNFTYDSEAYYFMKLYSETLFEILVSSLLFLDRLSRTLKC